MEQMAGSTGIKITANSYEEGASNERYIFGPAIWARRIARSLARTLSNDANPDGVSSQHSDPDTTGTSASVNIELPPVRNLLLLACRDEDQGGKSLRQDEIGLLDNDQRLFYLIRRQLSKTRNLSWSSLSLKTVTGIHFTKVSPTAGFETTIAKLLTQQVPSTSSRRCRASPPQALL
jgi:hypothetical protein